MNTFNPAAHIRNAARILVDGAWPNFHDAFVHSLVFDRGDIRPDDNVWIGPSIVATLELDALEKPFVAVLRFEDCEDVELSGFDCDNSVYALNFALEARGFYADGVTPLQPYLRVDFAKCASFSLRFKCIAIDVVERREIAAP
jgi:hypothetical protein